MTLVRCVENEDTWQRYTEVAMHKRREAAAPRARVKVQAKAKVSARNEHLKHVCVCVVERKDTRKPIVTSGVRHVQIVEKLVT